MIGQSASALIISNHIISTPIYGIIWATTFATAWLTAFRIVRFMLVVISLGTSVLVVWLAGARFLLGGILK